MYEFATAATLLLALSNAGAANFQGTIQNVTPYNGRLFIYVTGHFDGAASTCVSLQGAMVYSVDASTVTGKAILSAALTAKVTARQVYVYGDATCPSVNPYSGGGSENMAGLDLNG